MEGKDLLLLIVCSVVILLSFPSSGMIKFVPTWQIPLDVSQYRNGRTPADFEKLPLPIVSDVDGDGFKDIIFCTSDYQIKIADAAEIYDLKYSKGSQKVLPELPHTFSSSLLPKIGLTYGRKAVAINTGFIDPPTVINRKKIIVVLTESFLVMCFDQELNLLWEASPASNFDQNLYISEAAIEITATPVRNGDRGLVIIGGRTSKKSSFIEHEHASQKEFEASENSLINESNKEHETTEEEVDAEEHFSYYGLEGHSGSTRWVHEAGDFEDVPTADEFEKFNFGEFVDESLKQFFSRNFHHLGEVQWQQYASDIFEHLPSVWRVKEDTAITVDRFDKRRQFGGGDDEMDDNDSIFSMVNNGGPYDSTLFNRKTSSYLSPNVFVAKHSAGLEVIHLYSGRPLTTVKLLPGSLYADINGDNIIDKADAIADRSSYVKKNNISPNLDKCFALVTSGLPPSQILFEGSICNVQSALQKLKFGFDLFDTATAAVNTKIDVATPIFIRSANSLIFMVSNGKITSYNPEGNPNWEVSTPIQWHDLKEGKRSKGAGKAWRFPKLEGRETFSFPSLSAYPIEVASVTEFILAIGGSHVALLSPSGELFADRQAITPINAPPVIQDWDTDGYNDVIISTSTGFYGWRLESSSSSLLYPMISIAFVVTIIVMTISRTSSPKKKGAASPNSSNSGNANFRL